MSLITDILNGVTNSHPTTSQAANGIATDFVTPGIVGAKTSTAGVSPATGAFALNAQGTPDTTAAITAGIAYVKGTPTSQSSQVFRVNLTANQNVTFSANASGSTKYDWVYIKLDPTNLNAPNVAGDNAATIVTSRSTNITTDDGTPPTYGLVIAKVTLANGWTTITNGNITDARAYAVTSPQYVPCKFRAKPSGTESLASATWTTVINASKSYDTGNNFASGIFTAPVNGFYQFNANMRTTGAGGIYIGVGVRLSKNGSTVLVSNDCFDNNTSFDYMGASCADTIQLVAGDTVVMQAWVAVTGGTGGVDPSSSFSGFLVSVV